MTLLKVENITKAFGGLYALQSVDLEVRRGLITALIGPNGAGKTTLLNVINGLLRPDTGVVQLEGEEITHLQAHEVAKKGISRTFQILKVNQKLTVLEYLMVGRHLTTNSGILACIFSLPHSRAENEATEKAALDSLSLFNLTQYANMALSSLPHGIHRMVEITRAVISDPKLLLFDEPTSGLNPMETEVLLEALRSIKQKGITIFMIEHNMRLVMNVADWVTVLNFGKKITEGKPSEVTENSEVIEAYLGRKFIASAS